jgi:hypothetical protein
MPMRLLLPKPCKAISIPSNLPGWLCLPTGTFQQDFIPCSLLRRQTVPDAWYLRAAGLPSRLFLPDGFIAGKAMHSRLLLPDKIQAAGKTKTIFLSNVLSD